MQVNFKYISHCPYEKLSIVRNNVVSVSSIRIRIRLREKDCQEGVKLTNKDLFASANKDSR